MIFRTILLVLACLFLGAHFLRIGNLLFVLLSLSMPFLLLIRKRWSLILIQCFTYTGAGIWTYIAINLVKKRMARGLPYGRLLIILGAVILLTLLAGLLLNTASVRDKYPRGNP